MQSPINESTMRIFSRLLGVCGVAALLVASVVAQAPTADDIVAKYLTARGGADKLRAVNTVKMTGKLTGQPGEIAIVSWAKRPNMIRRESTLKEQKIIIASDGQTVWALNPMAGPTPREITGPQAEAAKQDASEFDPVLLDAKEKGLKVELVGTEPVGGVSTYHLRVTKTSGPSQDIFLNAETLLETKISMPIEQAGRKGTAAIEFSNFKTVDGIMVPFKIRQTLDGQTMAEVTYESIQFNAPVDDALFRMPK